MTKKKFQIYWPGITLMLSLAILAVPATIFYNIAMEAQEIAGNPVVGDRFALDLKPKITKNQVTELATAIENVSPQIIESVVNLRAATLRVNVLTEITITDEELSELLVSIKDTIFSKLPQSEYFTASLENKQYDIEIHVKTSEDRIDEAYRYIIAAKSAQVTAFVVQEVSTPKNPEYVASLNAALNPGTEDEEGDDE
ncbi:MAG: hypothetical protein KGZ51_01170 [Erysipelothrix sp.]|jgi:hypothetical protein|nr:hypothetical protein [Erysipelothrix sp.]